ncbi:MAG: preprotein translocase subunit SecE [Patescibacteria group bacterium]|jgi:preprotein translocase subunit SecE
MSLLSYFSESKDELRKVVWPTRKETMNGTIMVVVFSVVVAAFLGAADYVLNIAFEQLIDRF